MKPLTIDPFRRIVWPLAIAQIFMWAAMYYLFPALLLVWERDLGWSKTELSGAFTLALVVSAVFAPGVGRIIDRGFGSRIFTGSAILGSLLLVLLSMNSAGFSSHFHSVAGSGFWGDEHYAAGNDGGAIRAKKFWMNFRISRCAVSWSCSSSSYDCSVNLLGGRL